MWKKLCSVILIIVLLFGNISSVEASPSEDYKTFSQLDERWRNYSIVPGQTIGRIGCFITSFATLMAYANPELRNVTTFNPQVLASKCSFTSSGGIYSATVNNADSTFHWEGTVSISGEDAVEHKIKELLDQGKYVIVRAGPPIASGSTHFSPIVGWNTEANEPKIMDVAGGKHPEWKQWAPYVNRIDVARSEIQGSNKAFSEAGNNDNSIQSNAPKTEEEKQLLEQLIKEFDLQGMPTINGLPNQQKVDLPTTTGLSISENINLDSIKEARNNNSFAISEDLSRILMFLGIVLIFYSVLLLVALLYDWVNSFIDFSLISILTLGKYRLVSKDYFEKNKLIGYDKYKRQTNVTPLSCFIRIVCIAVIGILITSGVIQTVIIWVINFIKGVR